MYSIYMKRLQWGSDSSPFPFVGTNCLLLTQEEGMGGQTLLGVFCVCLVVRFVCLVVHGTTGTVGALAT